MAAINELTLGRPLNEIFMQYGFLSTVCMQKTMSLLNSVNYGTYNKIVYSFIYIFIIGALILWFITKNGIILHFFIIVRYSNKPSFLVFTSWSGRKPLQTFLIFGFFFCIYIFKNKNLFYSFIVIKHTSCLNNINSVSFL